jgi:ADP-ribose pyrophosphatase
VLLEEAFFKLHQDDLRLASGASYQYYTLTTFPFAVVILATTADGEYILNREYRHPTGEFLLSCPGGYLEGDEDPVVAAKRELREETGYEAKTFTIIGSAYPYAGMSSQKTIYVRAKEAFKAGDPQLDICEVIEPVLLSEQQLREAIRHYPLDGTLCTAFFLDSFNLS